MHGGEVGGEGDVLLGPGAAYIFFKGGGDKKIRESASRSGWGQGRGARDTEEQRGATTPPGASGPLPAASLTKEVVLAVHLRGHHVGGGDAPEGPLVVQPASGGGDVGGEGGGGNGDVGPAGAAASRGGPGLEDGPLVVGNREGEEEIRSIIPTRSVRASSIKPAER